MVACLVASGCDPSRGTADGGTADTGTTSDVRPDSGRADTGTTGDVRPTSIADADTRDASAADTGTTSDGAPAPLADCARAVGGSGFGQHVLRLESPAPQARVHLSRRVAGLGVGESVVYALGGMWIEQPVQGVLTCTAIVEASQLNYANSHHNFRDRAEATAGSVRYVVTMNFGFDRPGWDIRLTVHDAATGAMTLGPLQLTTTGGPTGLNADSSSLPVYVSELMPDNTTGWKNDAGETSPWIEIFNPSTGDVDLSGYFLSNDPAQPRRWSFQPGRPSRATSIWSSRSTIRPVLDR